MSIKQQAVYDKLATLNIEYQVKEHHAVYTIEEMEKLNLDNENAIAKNLFLRDDKKRNHYLVTLTKNKIVDLKALRLSLKSRPLTFCSEQDLDKYLGLTKGAVTPLGLLNDLTNKVEAVFDSELLKSDSIGIHPNENTATVFLKIEDLTKVLEHSGSKVRFIEIESKE